MASLARMKKSISAGGMTKPVRGKSPHPPGKSNTAYGLPYYAGNRNQRGHGFFSSLFRFAVPFLKRGGLSLAKHLLHTGSNIVSDVEAGRNLRDSAKERFVESEKESLKNYWWSDW